MYGGKLTKLTFTYTGTDVDAILDRLPTAEIVHADKGNNVYKIKAEVFGEGIDRWILSQGVAISDVVKQ